MIQYNTLGKPISVEAQDWASQPNQSIKSVTTTMTYDDMGRLLTLTDPDQGTFSYGYDADSHVIATTQTSGSSSRTVGYNYDLLGRIGCVGNAAPTINATGACSGGSTLIRNTYDSTMLGTKGSTDFPVGQLTQSLYYTYYPDGSRAGVTYQFQHDQRGRAITEQMQLSLPTAWNVTTALPTYQLTQAYNDANQPTTTSTQAGGTAGYTFTQVYDATNGSLQGLSNNGTATASLATLSYNANALLSQLTFQTSTGTSGLANEQFSYDGDLRPTGTSAVWLSSSGQSGTLFNQSTSYDNAGNVTSLTTTQAQVQGQSVSGGSQTENFCYDAQNHLLWAGNSGTQPGAGSGTCGSGTLSNTLAGSSTSYNNAYTYTDLGQLWMAPIDGSTNAKQYLYCDSAHPHQLTGVYADQAALNGQTAQLAPQPCRVIAPIQQRNGLSGQQWSNLRQLFSRHLNGGGGGPHPALIQHVGPPTRLLRQGSHRRKLPAVGHRFGAFRQIMHVLRTSILARSGFGTSNVRAIHRDQRHGVTLRQMCEKHASQSLFINDPVFQSFIETRPLAFKPRRQRQFRQRARPIFARQRIDQVEERVLGLLEALVHFVTKGFQCVKVHWETAPVFGYDRNSTLQGYPLQPRG